MLHPQHVFTVGIYILYNIILSEEVFSLYHCHSLHHIEKIQKHPGDIVEAGSLAVSMAMFLLC